WGGASAVPASSTTSPALGPDPATLEQAASARHTAPDKRMRAITGKVFSMHALFKMRLNPIIKTKPRPLSGPFRTILAKLCVQKATTTMNSKRAPDAGAPALQTQLRDRKGNARGVRQGRPRLKNNRRRLSWPPELGPLVKV